MTTENAALEGSVPATELNSDVADAGTNVKGHDKRAAAKARILADQSLWSKLDAVPGDGDVEGADVAVDAAKKPETPALKKLRQIKAQDTAEAEKLKAKTTDEDVTKFKTMISEWKKNPVKFFKDNAGDLDMTNFITDYAAGKYDDDIVELSPEKLKLKEMEQQVAELKAERDAEKQRLQNHEQSAQRQQDIKDLQDDIVTMFNDVPFAASHPRASEFAYNLVQNAKDKGEELDLEEAVKQVDELVQEDFNTYINNDKLLDHALKDAAFKARLMAKLGLKDSGAAQKTTRAPLAVNPRVANGVPQRGTQKLTQEQRRANARRALDEWQEKQEG